MLGELSGRLGRSEHAADAFAQAALRPLPGSPAEAASLARGLAEAGHSEDAARVAAQSLDVHDDAATAMLLGDILFNCASTGSVAAEKAYRRAVAGSITAAQRGLGECLARRGVLDEARDAHALWFEHFVTSRQGIALRERQDAARRRGVPPVALVTMQKSASEYIRANLLDALDVPEIPVSIGTIPVDRAVPCALAQLARGGALCRSHLSADNAAALAEAGLGRVLLHVRDPRQVTVSWAHMMRRLDNRKFLYAARMYDPFIPDALPGWSLEQQVGWAIENYLPGQVRWLQDWLQVVDARSPLRICLTTFEQFSTDQTAFYRRLLDFFEAPLAHPDRLDRRTPEAMRNFRSGSTSEWQDVFTSAQKRALRPLMAPLVERFGWPS
jgi:hypothetical protein